MKLTVLVDNNTLIDHYFIGEPAVSYFIETDDKRVLFDVGYSDAFLKNAQKLRIDSLDTPKHPLKGKKFVSRRSSSIRGHLASVLVPGEAGADRSLAKNGSRNISVRVDSQDRDDFMEDEIAVAYKPKDGLVVSNPCSHRGICNTIEYAKNVCGEDRVADVVCGFHLQNPSDEVLDGTVAYFAQHAPAALHPRHCTDLRSKIALAKVANLQEAGSTATLFCDGQQVLHATITVNQSLTGSEYGFCGDNHATFLDITVSRQ